MTIQRSNKGHRPCDVCSRHCAYTVSLRYPCFCCWHSSKINTCPTASVNYSYKLSYYFVKRKHTGFEGLRYFIPVITLKYGVPADIVFQSLAKVQYQTAWTIVFFNWPASGWLLFGRPLKKVGQAVWKSIPVNKLDLINNIHFDRLYV